MSTENINIETYCFTAPLPGLAHTIPLVLYVGPARIDVHSWKEVLTKLCLLIYDLAPSRLLALRNQVVMNSTRRMVLKSASDGMISPFQIADDLWIETNFSSDRLILIASGVAQNCGIRLESISVQYQAKSEIPKQVDDLKEVDSPTTSPAEDEPIKDFAPDSTHGGFYFLKSVDWSTFQSGIYIPSRFYDELVQNLKGEIIIGKSYPIQIFWDGKMFDGNILAPKFSDPKRKLQYSITWSKSSPIAQYLREKYADIYEALQNDRRTPIRAESTFEIHFLPGQDRFVFCKCGATVSDIDTACETDSEETLPTNVEETPAPPLNSNPTLNSKLAEILGANFPQGIRPKYRNDIQKFLRAAEGLIPEGTDIPELILSLGVDCGERVYVLTEALRQKIDTIVQQLSKEGHQLVYYSELFNRSRTELNQLGIYSAPVLQKLIEAAKPWLSGAPYYYMTFQKGLTVEQVVREAFGDEPVLTTDQLKERLPYIPFEKKVLKTLQTSPDFIRVTPELYALCSRVEFAPDERDENFKIIEKEIRENGYCPIVNLNVEKSLDLNPLLSESALRQYFYLKFASIKYDKKGNIITKKGVELNTQQIFSNFCLARREVTLDELLEKEEEIYEGRRYYILSVALDLMIRVDEDHFVSDSSIRFNTEAADRAIELFMRGNYMPVQEVTSFSSFPYIPGYPWNWFLLESYCRRFSPNFTYMSLAPNSSNVGAIVRKSARMKTFLDVMAEAAADSPLEELDTNTVGEYMFENHYIAQRTKTMESVAKKAILIREDREMRK